MIFWALYRNATSFMQADVPGWGRRLSLEGLLGFGAGAPGRQYTQVYRNGTIETVDARHLAHDYGGRPIINHTSFEKHVMNHLTTCLGVIQKLGVAQTRAFRVCDLAKRLLGHRPVQACRPLDRARMPKTTNADHSSLLLTYFAPAPTVVAMRVSEAAHQIVGSALDR